MAYSPSIDNPLSFLATYTFKLQIDKSGGDIRTRLDMVGELLGFVIAVVEGKTSIKGDVEKEILKKLEELEKDLNYLNQHYEPYIDFDLYTCKKNGAYRVELTRISKEVKRIIAQNKLISKDDLEGLNMAAPILGGLN